MPPLSPTSIAVIGASADEKKLGHFVLKNLLTQGYKGKVFPVNPKGGDILKKTAYASVSKIKESVDMAVVVVPAEHVNDVAEECGKKKVKTLVVISAGFKETGTDEGKKREDDLMFIAQKHGMDLIGPNCLGVLRPDIGLNASFAKDVPPEGSIALLSQSGALAVAVMDSSRDLHLGYSMIISMGNKATLDAPDYLEWCERDEKTNVIGLYLEDIKDGVAFRRIASRVAMKKPIVLIKSGTSERGKRAVSSHTGALAGSDAAIDALCVQTGIRRAKTYDEFLTLLQVLSMEPPLLTRSIGVVTNAGGPGILATDAAEKEGLVLTDLSPETEKKLKKLLPLAASVRNPVDILGDADEKRYADALLACAADPNVDGLVAIVTPQVMTPCEKIAEKIIAVHKKSPLVPLVTCFMGGDAVHGAIELLRADGIPNFASPSSAMRALRSLLVQPPHPGIREKDDAATDDRASESHELLKPADGYIDELLVQDLLALYGLPVPEQGIAQTKEEAIDLARSIGFPVIAKVSSPDLPHKTDVGGVKARLMTEDDVARAYDLILKNVAQHAPAAGLNGVLIQKFLPLGHELIAGAVRDPSFGPLLMVGLGGIYTELMRDVSFRLAPITEKDAYEMMQELKSWKLFLGARGEEQLDIPALAHVLVTLSDLMQDNPRIAEVDFNPILLKQDGLTIADAKVKMASPEREFRN